MKTSRYNPLIERAAHAYNPLVAKGQQYSYLILPAAGSLTWTSLNHIVAVYKLPYDFNYFALIDWPATALSIFVRDNGTRYKLNDSSPAQSIYSVPYAGQVLSHNAIFEVWNAGASPTTFPEYSLTISYRTQICCCDDSEGVEYTALLYLPVCESYPVCLPICS